MTESDTIESPEFETFTTTQQDGSPNIVSVRPVKRGFTTYDEQYIFSTIASKLQSIVIASVKAYSVSISDLSLGKINGILQMNNVSDPRHAHTDDVDLCDLGNYQIQSLFDKVVEYGEIGILMLNFAFG
jgi:hypothetical protein